MDKKKTKADGDGKLTCVVVEYLFFSSSLWKRLKRI